MKTEGGSGLLGGEELARLATKAAADKQAADIVVLDAKGLCSFTDYFVICSGDSERQIASIWREIDETLKSNGAVAHHSEGTADSGWILADFGSVIIHIFGAAEREYYQLDKLWDKGIPVVRIQ
jgi:ribosome-associated protein